VNKPLIIVVGRELSQAEGIRGPGFGAGRRYFESITRAGGMPVIVVPIAELRPGFKDLVHRVDGVVLHGGGDINPQCYGQEPHTETLYGLNDLHDEIEIALTREVLAAKIPLLAICRGLQIVNVVCGGTLIQDLEQDFDPHIADHPNHRRMLHPVNLSPDSRVAKAMGTVVAERCQSFHHQAIDRLGSGLVVTGQSTDGVIEAVEVTGDHWGVAVQWHPEDTAADDVEQQGLFNALVREARHRS
jgi:putative glutamine amidotransferase